MAVTTDSRAQLIAAALQAADKKPDIERVRLSWQTDEIMATVIRIPLSAVVLNPRSHRIRAQLESAARREAVDRDPFGDEAQELIAGLLRDTERFEELKSNLKDVGQTDPGVVSHTGLLVNANTRCVALRDLGNRYIRVAVLPEDASEEEIDRLELRLQMKRDFRRDYTFSNELLFIDDLVKRYRYKPKEIAIEMNWASPSENAGMRRAEELVQQRLRMLAIIREVQHMSANRLALTGFDTARQAIMELDDDYERLKKRDEAAARKLRDTRLVGLLSGAGYRELREINETFLEDYLVPSMEEQELLGGHVERVMNASRPNEADGVPGLDVLEPEATGQTANGQNVSNLLALLAESAGKERVVIPNDRGPKLDLPRAAFVEELKQAVESAAQDARDDRQKGDLLDRPRMLVRKAGRILKSATEALQKVKDRRDFNRQSFRVAVRELNTSQEALEKMISDKAE